MSLPAVRSLLFIPATRPEFVAKALSGAADALIVDLEDSVPVEQKEPVRGTLSDLVGPAAAARPTWVRVNGPDTAWFGDDVSAAVSAGAHGIVVPKVDSEAVRQQATAVLDAADRDGSVSMTLIIESAAAVLALPTLTTPSGGRAVQLAFGAYDFAFDAGVRVAGDWSSVATPRAMVSIAAHALGAPAVDSAYADIADLDGLRANTRQGRDLGYTSKLCIHPSQVDIVNDELSPTAEEIAWSRRVVASFQEATAAGRAAIRVDGRLIDYPIAFEAERLLARASSLGLQG